MDAALAAEGVLPISTRPVYMSPGDQLTAASFQGMSMLAAENAVKRAAQDRLLRSGGELPPSPPIFSTSFVVAQRNFGVERPELIAEDSFNDFEDYARSRLAMRVLAAADTKVVPQTAMERAATSSTNRYRKAVRLPSTFAPSAESSTGTEAPTAMPRMIG